MNSPMTAPPPIVPPQKRTLASFLPDRKILAGGFSGLLAWLILTLLSPVLMRYGFELPSDAQAQLAGLLGLIIAWTIPPSDQDIISRMNNRLVQMANADPGSAVSLPQATTSAPPVEGSTVVVAPKASPVPPPGKLASHAWPLVILLPLVIALAGCAGKAATIDTAPAATQISDAAQKAKAALDAVCRNYQYADAVFDLMALTGRIPQKVFDAEATAVNQIAVICANPPTDARTALAAAERAYATMLAIREQWKA